MSNSVNIDPVTGSVFIVCSKPNSTFSNIHASNIHANAKAASASSEAHQTALNKKVDSLIARVTFVPNHPESSKQEKIDQGCNISSNKSGFTVTYKKDKIDIRKEGQFEVFCKPNGFLCLKPYSEKDQKAHASKDPIVTTVTAPQVATTATNATQSTSSMTAKTVSTNQDKIAKDPAADTSKSPFRTVSSADAAKVIGYRFSGIRSSSSGYGERFLELTIANSKITENESCGISTLRSHKGCIIAGDSDDDNLLISTDVQGKFKITFGLDGKLTATRIAQ